MKKKLFSLVPALALSIFIIACGDDDSTINVNPADFIDSEFETLEDLPKCTSKKEGDTVYVDDKDAQYTCEDGEWNKVSVKNTAKSSSSKKVSSSSVKAKSSSSKKVSSSSVKAKSSSSKKVSSSSVKAKSSSSKKVSSSSEKPKSSSSSEKVSSSSVKPKSSSNSEKVSSSSVKPKSSSSSEKVSSSSEKPESSSSSEKVSSSSEKPKSSSSSEKVSSSSEKPESSSSSEKVSSSSEKPELSSSSLNLEEEFGACGVDNENVIKSLKISGITQNFVCTDYEWELYSADPIEVKLKKACRSNNVNDVVQYCPTSRCKVYEKIKYVCQGKFANPEALVSRYIYEWEEEVKN